MTATEMPRTRHIAVFCSDLDGTLLGRPESTARFTAAWESIEDGKRPLLVYSTGRTVADTRALVVARQLPPPDYIVGGIGTELYSEFGNLADGFQQQFGEAWSITRVNEIAAATPGVQRQPSEFPQPFKSSWRWVRAGADEIEQLQRRLRAAGIRAHVHYSCRYFLDIVPACAGKGNALAWLCRQLAIPLENVLVAGDTAHDTPMYLLPGVCGIVVENALPELLAAVVQQPIFVARSSMADGVIEGLQHFGVLAPPVLAASRPAALPAQAMASRPRD